MQREAILIFRSATPSISPANLPWLIVWKIPGKGLKKKKRYRAYLYTEDPKKEFKPDKQWVVFRIRPEHAIVFVDSTVQLMQDGLLQLYLPVGQHTYQVISPFYENKKETNF